MPKKPKGPEPLTPEDIRHIRELWLQGVSVAELSGKFEQTRAVIWGVLEGQRPPASKDAPRILECSFCGHTQHECVMLIAGPHCYICDQCVQMCVQIIMEERPGYVRIEIGPPHVDPQTSPPESKPREGDVELEGRR